MSMRRHSGRRMHNETHTKDISVTQKVHTVSLRYVQTALSGGVSSDLGV